jgi:hypothetical protein
VISREFFVGYCVDRGLFEGPAREVVAMAEAGSAPEMAAIWGGEIEGYSPVIKAFLAVLVDEQALRWIDANLPGAFCRGMFAKATRTAPGGD